MPQPFDSSIVILGILVLIIAVLIFQIFVKVMKMFRRKSSSASQDPKRKTAKKPSKVVKLFNHGTWKSKRSVKITSTNDNWRLYQVMAKNQNITIAEYFSQIIEQHGSRVLSQGKVSSGNNNGRQQGGMS